MGTNVYRRRIDAAALAADEFDGEAVHPDGLTEAAIDALLEDVDRELQADEAAAAAAFRHDFSDQRRASRSRRRASRELLRTNFLTGGLTGQGKSNVALLAQLTEGEAA